MRKHIIILVLFFISLQSFAQRHYKFTGRTDKFIYELGDFMTEGVDRTEKKVIEEYLLKFGETWNDTMIFTEKQKKKIIKYCNKMTIKRYRYDPYFYNFLNSTVAARRDALIGGELFDKWLESVSWLLEGRSKSRFNQYLEFSNSLFSDSLIYNSRNVRWKVSGLKFSIEKEGRFPSYSFPDIDLNCYTRGDTSLIERTSGVYNPILSKWVGKGGKVYWTRVGLDPNKVWVELDKYDMLLKGAKLFADTVTFYNYNQFSEPMTGHFIEKVSASPGRNPSYPQFTSFKTDLVLKNVFENVDYQGGYSLKGAKVIGSGTADNNACFIFKREGENFIYAGAASFLLESDRIVSDDVSVKIVLENDSIYHPGLSIQYLDQKKELSLYRKEKGLDQTPFINSYHMIDMYVEGIYWKMDEDFLDLKAIQQAGSRSEARFISVDFFSQREYDRLQGLDRINPVKELYNYVKQIGINEFYVDEYARYIGFSKAVAMQTLMRLAVQGFVIYDMENNSVFVKSRVYDYVEASQGRIDFDVIRFQSQTRGIPNASMSLLNYDLKVEGVDNVFLSDSQKVYIYPRKGQLLIKKNRDFVFEGLIKAGRFDLFAKECYFSYNKFELDMPIIDSLSFKVKSFEKDEYGMHRQVRVKTVIEDLQGNLLLDKPNNKSGRKSYPEYPILNSKSNSFVYYDRKNRFPGVYKREEFYYKLQAFQIDSLDDFETEGLEFNGSLNSAGIFPTIVEPLKVQPDYSLGFKSLTGPSGTPVYANKGKFYDTISLSNQGLLGSGKLTYLTSTSYSDEFRFFPDSTNARLNSYDIAEKTSGTEYPRVVGQNIKMSWLPYSDVMYTSDIKEEFPFVMYNKQAELHGGLKLTPSLLSGKGLITIEDAEMESNEYKFQNIKYNTDTCDFRLKAFVDDDMGMGSLSQTNENAYSTSNFKAEIDFEQRVGSFEANGSEQKVEFNDNMYICYMDMFIWYMDEDKTEFASKEGEVAGINAMELEDKVDLRLTGSEFYSVHPDQDSLSFVAQRAVYKRRKAEIHAFDVQFILTADAAVTPTNKEVKIYRKAEMQEFTNSEILINTTTKYHKIHSATVNIHGRKRYTGRGVFDYKDLNGNIQNIYFNDIYVDTTGQSLAFGEIAEESKFTLSPNFAYKGNVNLIATKKNLKFSGGTQISHACDTLDREWLYFSAFIDPADVMIPINDSSKTVDNIDIYAGIFQTRMGHDVYPNFIKTNLRKSDHIISNVGGYLTYDDVSQEYRISSLGKLRSNTGPDDFISLSKRSCEIYNEGKLEIASDPGAIQFDSYGNLSYYMRKDSTMTNVAIAMDFFFDDKAFDLMIEDINSNMNLSPVQLDNDNYMTAVGQIVGQEEMEELQTEIATNAGRYKRVPKELQKRIFFSNVEFKYNPRSRAFVSEGQIGIGHIGKEQINKYVDGVIQIENKSGRTEINIALEFDGDYYYFSYDNRASLMRAYSSNKEFVERIKEIKPKDRKMKTESGESYSYYLSSPTSYKKFIRTVELRR